MAVIFNPPARGRQGGYLFRMKKPPWVYTRRGKRRGELNVYSMSSFPSSLRKSSQFSGILTSIVSPVSGRVIVSVRMIYPRISTQRLCIVLPAHNWAVLPLMSAIAAAAASFISTTLPASTSSDSRTRHSMKPH